MQNLARVDELARDYAGRALAMDARCVAAGAKLARLSDVTELTARPFLTDRVQRLPF